MKIINPFVVLWALTKLGVKLVLPLAVIVAKIVALTLITTLVGFAAGALVDLFHLAPFSFKLVGAAVAFVSHVWKAAQ